MWTAKETMRALRGQRVAIVRNWQAEAQARLWHLDRRLFARKGAASACAGATLNFLIDCYQDPSNDPVGFLAGLGVQSRPFSYPQEDGSDLQDAAPVAPADAAPLPAGADGPATNIAPNPSPGEANAPILPDRVTTAVSLSYARAGWQELPLAWTDIRLLLALLAAHTRRALAERGADSETLAQVDGRLDALFAAAADDQIGRLERELASHREEAVVTHHLAGRFLANASHEIRTPLTAVLGFAELLLEETYGLLSEEQRTAVGHIENSAQNLLENVNNLLDLLHIRAGKLTLQYRPVEVGEVLRDLYNILVPLARRKNVRFRADMPATLGAIEADEKILRHIVYHLLASALRATPADGLVTLTAAREGPNLAIITNDTALHLPPEAIANMLDPFPRLENSPARGYEGWEVGLPLVRRYVELHGGKLETTSLPEQGTTFRVVLPIVRSVIGTAGGG